MEEHGNIELESELVALGYNYRDLKKQTKKYVREIYLYKESILEDMDKSIENIKKSKITISGVAEQIDCSRTTIYQNSILKHYIELIEKDITTMNPYNEIQILQNEIEDLNEKLDNMKKRDAELLLLKKENNVLKKRNQIKQSNIISF